MFPLAIMMEIAEQIEAEGWSERTDEERLEEIRQRMRSYITRQTGADEESVREGQMTPMGQYVLPF